MSPCYRNGGCGPYEMYSCSECPASKKSYLLKNLNIFVGVINGEVKDDYMAIGLTKDEAIKNCLFAYFSENGHTEKELEDYGCYITITKFDDKKMYSINESNSVEKNDNDANKVECNFNSIFLTIRKHITNFDVMKSLSCKNKHTITRELSYMVLNELDCTNPYDKDIESALEIINRFTEDDVIKMIEKNPDKIDLSETIAEKTIYKNISISEYNKEEKCYTITASLSDASDVKPITKVYSIGVVMFLDNDSSKDPEVLNIVEKILTTMI